MQKACDADQAARKQSMQVSRALVSLPETHSLYILLQEFVAACRGRCPLPLHLLVQLHQSIQVGSCQVLSTAVADVPDGGGRCTCAL